MVIARPEKARKANNSESKQRISEMGLLKGE
jgi:hypothetical protein